MKIAEALIHIKDIKGKLSTLQEEIHSDSSFELLNENDTIPSIEDKISLLQHLSVELASFKTRITKTNAKNGLTDKINKMEALRSIQAQLNGLTRNKQKTTVMRHIDYNDPAMPVTVFSTFNVSNLSKNLDLIQEEIRNLDLELQKLNWTIDIED